MQLILLHLELGRLYFLEGQHAKAVKHYQWVHDALDHPERYNLRNARTKLVFQEANNIYPQIANAYAAAKKLDDAEAMFKRANEARPNKGRLAANLAQIALDRKRPADAIEQLEIVFREKYAAPGQSPYKLLADALRELHKDAGEARQKLIKRLEAARAEDAKNEALLAFLGEEYLKGGEIDKAESLYQDLKKQRPGVAAYRGLVKTYLAAEKADRVIETLGDLATKSITLDALEDVVAQIAGDDQLYQAIIQATAGDVKTPADSSPGVLLATAWLARQREQWDEADKRFAASQKLDKPSQAEAAFSWGLELLFSEQFERSIARIAR